MHCWQPQVQKHKQFEEILKNRKFNQYHFQIVFMPIGEGVAIGSLRIDMYTSTAFFIAILCLVAALITYFFFVEDYAGMITKEEKKGRDDESRVSMFQLVENKCYPAARNNELLTSANSSLKLPKFDWPPVILCFLLWYKINMFAATIEGLAYFFFDHSQGKIRGNEGDRERREREALQNGRPNHSHLLWLEQ